MDQHRNNSVNSIRRVVEYESCSSEVDVLLTKSRDGSYAARTCEKAPGAVAAVEAEDVTEVRVEFFCEEPALINHDGSALHLCIEVLADGADVLALASHNASRVQVSRDHLVSISQLAPESTGDDAGQLLAEAHLHLQARLLASVIPSATRTVVYQPNDRLAVLLDENLQDDPNKSVWYVRFAPATDASASSSKGRTITLRSGASRRAISQLLPADISLLTYLGRRDDEADEDLATLRSCLPRQCAVVPFAKLLPAHATATAPTSSFTAQEALSFLAAKFSLPESRSHPAVVVRATDLAGRGRLPEHDGAVIVDWTGRQKVKVQSRPVDHARLFSSTKTYILVGLASQMGQSICKWIARNGARHIVVTSRNPPRDGQRVAEMETLGAKVRIEAADVTRREDVVRLREEVAEGMPPVAGIMNGAMLLADGLFADMTFENMQKVLAPKVDGSRILDDVFSTAALDFFVMLSSVNAATGMAGQANYSAANMFMVGLAADRRARGLAASVVDIGMVIGIGVIQRTEGDAGTGVIERNLRRQNLAPISERDLHHMLAEAIVAGTRDVDVEIITGLQRYQSSSPNRPSWYKNLRFSHLVTEVAASVASDGSGGNTATATLASAANAEEASEILQTALIEYLAAELKLPAGDMSADTPIIDLGVDSLVAAAIRSWLLSEHKVEVPIRKILGGSSVRQVCQESVSKLSFAVHETDSEGQDTKAAAATEPFVAKLNVTDEASIMKKQGPLVQANKASRRGSSSSSLSSSSAVSTPQETGYDASLASSAVEEAYERKANSRTTAGPEKVDGNNSTHVALEIYNSD